MKWINRSVQLPKKGKKCLFFDPTCKEYGCGTYESEVWVDEMPNTCGCNGIDPYGWSHWMPLPEVPNEMD